MVKAVRVRACRRSVGQWKVLVQKASLKSQHHQFLFVQVHLASVDLDQFLLLSDEGVQQGDPLGPLLFCATSLKLASSMTSLTSEFNTWYLDDGTIGGKVRSLLSELVGPSIGLLLNEEKCEIITDDVSLVATLKTYIHSKHTAYSMQRSSAFECSSRR
jgi:hypothetical protein